MPTAQSGYVIIADETVLDGSVEMFGKGRAFCEAEVAATLAEALPPQLLLQCHHRAGPDRDPLRHRHHWGAR